MEIKNNLDKFMKTYNLKQSLIAKKIGVSKSYISKIVNYKCTPGKRVMFLLANLFNCGVDDIFYIKNVDYKTPSIYGIKNKKRK